jgi:hypothetical protein
MSLPGDDVLDPELVRALGAAAPALREWGALKQIRYRHHRWFVNGKTTALVGVVYEEDLQEGATKVILKLDRVAGERLDAAEYVRQRAAVRDSPAFAERHLARLAEPGHDLVRVGQGWWIVFQTIAGGSVDDLDVLTKWLASARSGRPVGTGTNPRRTVTCDEDTFARLCGHIVHCVLEGWQGRPGLDAMSVPSFLARHLGGRHRLDGLLRDAATMLTARTLRFPDEPGPLPNPLALLLVPEMTARIEVRALVGKAHGDLHTENVLIPARSSVDRSAFRLIDLAKYDERAPLSRDPAHFLLYIIARALEDLKRPQADALIRVLVDPDSGYDRVLPGWLRALISAIRDAGERWAHPTGLISEWRAQFQMSLLGCALIFYDRPSTRDEDRLWFLRLAAHAAAAVLGQDAPAPSSADQVVDEAGLLSRRRSAPAARGGEWIARMCAYLPYLRQRAREIGNGDAVEDMARRASAGEELAKPFIALVRQLGGPADGLRGPDDGPPRIDEVFTCPLAVRCPRVEQLQPGDREPECHLRPGRMRTEFW